MTTAATRWLWLRHAPIAAEGRIVGRSELAAELGDGAALAGAASALETATVLLTSPLRRCRETAEALRAARPSLPRPVAIDDLAEQDFGVWEGRRYDEVAAFEGLDMAALAALRPPHGESFEDVVARFRGAAARLAARHAGETLALVAHAGVIRAALALALDLPPHRALAFAVAPLALTVLVDHGSGGWAVECVNRSPGGAS